MTINSKPDVGAIIILAAIVFSVPATADTFTEGGDAYKRKDYATAAAKFREVAAKGDHRAMYALGSMYAGGAGVKLDYQEAFKWFTAAAKYGRPDALYKIGLMYELGVGVKQDFRQAARYYLKTAELGYAHGQFKLGQLYLRGNGMQADPVKAFAWMYVARLNFLNSKSAEPAPEEGLPQSGDIFATIHLELINTELNNLKPQLTSVQLAEAEKLVKQYSRYHR